MCASDGAQDKSECHLRQQACKGNVTIHVAKQGTCGGLCVFLIGMKFRVFLSLIHAFCLPLIPSGFADTVQLKSGLRLNPF